MKNLEKYYEKCKILRKGGNFKIFAILRDFFGKSTLNSLLIDVHCPVCLTWVESHVPADGAVGQDVVGAEHVTVQPRVSHTVSSKNSIQNYCTG